MPTQPPATVRITTPALPASMRREIGAYGRVRRGNRAVMFRGGVAKAVMYCLIRPTWDALPAEVVARRVDYALRDPYAIRPMTAEGVVALIRVLSKLDIRALDHLDTTLGTAAIVELLDNVTGWHASRNTVPP